MQKENSSNVFSSQAGAIYSIQIINFCSCCGSTVQSVPILICLMNEVVQPRESPTGEVFWLGGKRVSRMEYLLRVALQGKMGGDISYLTGKYNDAAEAAVKQETAPAQTDDEFLAAQTPALIGALALLIQAEAAPAPENVIELMQLNAHPDCTKGAAALTKTVQRFIGCKDKISALAIQMQGARDAAPKRKRAGRPASASIVKAQVA